MQIELHIIQNFAPSNLNRDDTGSPKDCVFGGVRRARISSQAQKRAMRETFRSEQLLPEERLARRTKRIVDAIAGQLTTEGRELEDARRVVQAALGALEIKAEYDKSREEWLTQYLIYAGQQEIDTLTALCRQHWDALLAAAPALADGQASARAAKRAGREAVLKDVADALKRALDGGRAADLALFGRMLADLPERNIDAASQVAHAISTHQVSVDFDYYTAVDDLRPGDTAGADMIGTVEFNSACFYRYANVNVDQLRQNLGGDEELTRQTLRAFLRAAVDAIPTGKQNSMAAQNPPSLVMTVARQAGLWSLANAFVKPVRPGHDGDLIADSVRALDQHWQRLTAMYGPAASGVTGVWLATMEEPAVFPTLAMYGRAEVASVIEETVAACNGGGA
ncbi:MAG: type I-E CRISPR-associated protein Cas7/Cse4/CasC [Dehalococcoidia bacterium]